MTAALKTWAASLDGRGDIVVFCTNALDVDVVAGCTLAPWVPRQFATPSLDRHDVERKRGGGQGGRSRIFFDEPVSTSSENALERRALYRDHSASIYLGPQRGCQGSIASPICGARRVLPVVCGPLACGRTPPPASTFLPSGIGVCGMYSACLHEQPLMYSLR